MIEINNKHIVLIFIIIIVGIFIYNYDVYVISKNQPLCKPIYVTKREITPEIRAELNKEESGVLKETFSNLSKSGYLEGFGNLPDESIKTNISSNNFDVPPKSFGSFTIPSITNKEKLKVIDSVIKILSYIPTNYCETQIKQLVEYFGIIYQNSSDLETFYKNVSASTKIKEDPYNSKYSHLILFLIGKFDNDYSNCGYHSVSNEQCAMNELIGQIMESNPTQSTQSNPTQSTQSNPTQSTQSTQSNPTQSTQSNPTQSTQSNPTQSTQSYPTQSTQSYPTQSTQSYQTQPSQHTQSDYLSSEINTLMEHNNNNVTPSEIMSIISKSKQNSKNSQNKHINSEKIYPSISSNTLPNSNNNNLDYLSNSLTESKSNYLEEQYPSKSYGVPNYTSSQPSYKKQPNQTKPTNPTNCGGAKCTLKCDSSYMSAIKYLDGELKPLEGFGNIGSGYAPF
jgi:hypothetical protein